MKTIPLRNLLRDPRSVKRMTAAGKSVQITDRGKPLWMIKGIPPPPPADTTERDRLIDELLDEMLAEKPSGISLSKIILDSRG